MPAANLGPSGIMRAQGNVSFTARDLALPLVTKMESALRKIINEQTARLQELTTDLTALDQEIETAFETLASSLSNDLFTRTVEAASLVLKPSIPMRVGQSFNFGSEVGDFTCFEVDPAFPQAARTHWFSTGGRLTYCVEYSVDKNNLPDSVTFEFAVREEEISLPSNFRTLWQRRTAIQAAQNTISNYINSIRAQLSNKAAMLEKATSEVAQSVARQTPEGSALMATVDNLSADALMAHFDVPPPPR